MKLINLFLLGIIVLLVLNIFFNFDDLVGGVIKEDLKCEINGNFVGVNLCCHEMQRFLSCENGKCESKNYDILFGEDVLRYCKREGYDVKF